ncbi:hypothetical protein OPS25_08675 [Alteromonas ponticola]|uniref:DUF3806 domain-containing protein n=1 Tax=Alteromonas aquimaris TaxID=2998417 RepID=A0ABT3P740_9ALTE|nr:hypothetical protein [Alteromonas aquimaris]MCW8108569.1 hypothetical protein [Alteromonas aquimaris]
MQQHELDQLMKECASDAVQTAQEEFNVKLDLTQESLGSVDNVLLSFVDKYQDKALEDNAVFTICNIYGAYIGEVFKKIAGGTWRYDQSNPDAPFVVLDVGERSYAFSGICYERLVNNSAISVKNYFEKALANQTQ